jgi:hypothetical protein
MFISPTIAGVMVSYSHRACRAAHFQALILTPKTCDIQNARAIDMKNPEADRDRGFKMARSTV